MTLPILREDSLRVSSSDDGPAGFQLRLSLPWIRSLPVASVADLAIALAGEPARNVRVRLGDRAVAPSGLADEPGWWFLQDRLVVSGEDGLAPGHHQVTVTFRLMVPYLPAGPDAPLFLPFRATASLVADASPAPTVSHDVA